MKNLLIVIALLLAFVAPALPVSAQTYLTSTTLSAAVTSTSQTTINVTSATGFTVGYTLYVDGEAMSITSVSGTTIGVFRGVVGTTARTHASASTVIVGPPPAFTTADPGPGSCTVANQAYLPIVNTVNGNVWMCRGVAGVVKWTATNSRFLTYNSLLLTQ